MLLLFKFKIKEQNNKNKYPWVYYYHFKQLDAGNGEKVPTYEEVLDLVSETKVKLLLHIKESKLLNKE